MFVDWDLNPLGYRNGQPHHSGLEAKLLEGSTVDTHTTHYVNEEKGESNQLSP
jgi:hypothetical protein